MLECATTASSCFVTLTYNQVTQPLKSTLNPKDVTNWLKRIRQAIYPEKLRYYVVGEYGDKTGRPHYHAAIFGLNQELGGGIDGRRGLVSLTWKNGHTYTGDLSTHSAGYICGYVTKKLTKKGDPRLMGKHPEFARMSRRPGIGASAMKDVATAYEEYLSNETFRNGKFPSVLQHGKKKLPLGRYLRAILRQQLGYGRQTTEEEKHAFREKMLQMQKDDAETAKAEKRAIRSYYQMSYGKTDSDVARFKIYDRKGAL